MTSYWCELAWLGGDRAEPGVLVEVEQGRVSSLELGVASAPANSTTLAGVTIPGLANAHSHAFQRLLRGRTQAERGSFWSWRERMYDAAARARPGPLPGAGAGDLRRDGDRRDHGGRGVSLPAPRSGRQPLRGSERDGEGGDRGGRERSESGSPCSTRATCTAGSASRSARSSGASPTATSNAGSSGWMSWPTVPGVRIGAAIHSVRSVDPESAARVAEWVGERPLHAHVSEQPAENEACQAAYGVTPTESLADAGVLDRRFTAVHATHVSDHDVELLGRPRTGGRRLRGLPLPDHRARPRRRRRTGQAPPRRRRGADAGQRLERDHRPLRGGPRGRARREAGRRRAGPAQPGRSPSATRPPVDISRSAGTPPAFSAGCSPTSSPSGSTASAWRARTEISSPRLWSSRRPPPTCGTCSSAASSIVRDGACLAVDAAAELDAFFSSSERNSS